MNQRMNGQVDARNSQPTCPAAQLPLLPDSPQHLDLQNHEREQACSWLPTGLREQQLPPLAGVGHAVWPSAPCLHTRLSERGIGQLTTQE